MTAAEHKSDLELTKETSYITLTGKLSGVCCEDFGENWLFYNDTALCIMSRESNFLLHLMIISIFQANKIIHCRAAVLLT